MKNPLELVYTGVVEAAKGFLFGQSIAENNKAIFKEIYAPADKIKLEEELKDIKMLSKDQFNVLFNYYCKCAVGRWRPSFFRPRSPTDDLYDEVNMLDDKVENLISNSRKIAELLRSFIDTKVNQELGFCVYLLKNMFIIKVYSKKLSEAAEEAEKKLKSKDIEKEQVAVKADSSLLKRLLRIS